MTREEFEQLVAQGFESIPEKFRRKIKNVVLLIEDEPSPELRKRERLSDGETLLGYYQGVPETARGDHYGIGPTLPDTITLFQKPIIEEAYGVPERIRQVVADTVWHEFAHYFGLDESAVQRRERERGVE
jgi:predicted Zn-dependent protease with MMP-like domain